MNTYALYKRQLGSFNISRTILRIFYKSGVASAVLNAFVCVSSRLRVVDANRLNLLICKASDIVGLKLKAMRVVTERRMLHKVKVIPDNTSMQLAPLTQEVLQFQTDCINVRKMSTTGSCLW